MKFFLDTADVKELRELNETGLVDGVTTNPSLVAQTGQDFIEVIKEICTFISGPVSAEVTATDFDTMLKEGEKLAKIADNIAVKVPLTEDGLKVCKALSDNGVMVNVTLCFSPLQALLAGKAGATFISPFVGRVDDIGSNGLQLVSDILTIYDQYEDIGTQVLVASVRHVGHMLEAATMGADVATLPPKVFRAMYKHPLTDKGLAAFLKDWEKTGQSIL